MREVAFITKNKDTWLRFQDELRSKSADPERLSRLFIKVNNDLAYAQTYYPKSKLIVFLNALSATAYNRIHQKKSNYSDFVDFWLTEIPLLSYTYRRFYYLSLFTLFLFVAIGWLSSVYDPGFAQSVLGSNYIHTTQANVENGDPLAVYNNDTVFGDFTSFFYIAFNNIWVGLRAFVFGLIGGIGSLLVMMQNGIMIGTFQHMFYENRNFFLSLRTIWIHGAMEIFAMVIEIGAGILMGTSYLFPGRLSRKQAFLQKTKAGVKIFISTLPFTFSAAVLEGYVTQYANEMPAFFAFAIVFATLGIIVYYYLIYPVLRFRNSPEAEIIQYSEILHERV